MITIPNVLSLIRIILIPFFIHLFLKGNIKAALAVLFIASLTDLLDGFIARAFNQRSRVGYILDPLADKLLMDSTYILFSLKSLELTVHIPQWITITVVSRDIIIVIGASILYLLNPQRILKPHWLGKATTTVQMATAIVVLFVNVSRFTLPYLNILFWLTGGLTLISGIYYIYRGMLEME